MLAKKLDLEGAEQLSMPVPLGLWPFSWPTGARLLPKHFPLCFPLCHVACWLP